MALEFFFQVESKVFKEHKQVKRLMRECGGSGKHFSIPPPDFVPHSFSIGNKCVKYRDNFENEKSLKRHIQLQYNEVVKKAFSKVAM